MAITKITSNTVYYQEDTNNSRQGKRRTMYGPHARLPKSSWKALRKSTVGSRRGPLKGGETELRSKGEIGNALASVNRDGIDYTQEHNAKAPTPANYSGKSSKNNSTSVKASSSAWRRRQKFPPWTSKELATAMRYLDGRAATWFLRLEALGNHPTSVENLRKKMFNYFVRSMEKSEAKMELFALRMVFKSELDKHIDKYEELMETSETDMKEAHSYFPLTLPEYFKIDLAKYVEGETPDNIYKAYCRVLTLVLTHAPKWNLNSITGKNTIEDRGNYNKHINV